MRFLIDQDVYRVTSDQLNAWGHDVVLAKDIGKQRAPDRELLMHSKETGRLLVTRDKDYGSLVFLEEMYSSGVILLRMTPLSIEDVHKELHLLLQKYTEEELKHLFCVVEPHRFRIRHLNIET